MICYKNKQTKKIKSFTKTKIVFKTNYYHINVIGMPKLFCTDFQNISRSKTELQKSLSACESVLEKLSCKIETLKEVKYAYNIQVNEQDAHHGKLLSTIKYLVYTNYIYYN